MFQTQFDLFEYLVLFFDLTNAPASFQFYINRALSEYLNNFYRQFIEAYSEKANTLNDYIKAAPLKKVRNGKGVE